MVSDCRGARPGDSKKNKKEWNFLSDGVIVGSSWVIHKGYCLRFFVFKDLQLLPQIEALGVK